jgi:hypothetical protein
VTAMPFEALDTMLDVLRNERNLQIRYFDPQTAGVSPSVFIETAPSVRPKGNIFGVPDHVAAGIEQRVGSR